MIRAVRGAIVRLYSVFYVNTLDYVLRAGLIGETQAALGTMLEIKPILTIEDGRLITMEKARTTLSHRQDDRVRHRVYQHRAAVHPPEHTAHH